MSLELPCFPCTGLYLLLLDFDSAKYFRKYFFHLFEFVYLSILTSYTYFPNFSPPTCIHCTLSCPLALFVHIQIHTLNVGSHSLATHPFLYPQASTPCIHITSLCSQVFCTHSYSARILTHSAHMSSSTSCVLYLYVSTLRHRPAFCSTSLNHGRKWESCH